MPTDKRDAVIQLLAPFARYLLPGAIVVGLAGWAWVERAGRQIAQLELAAAQREIATLQQRIRNMEARRVEEDRAFRDPDPLRSLRDEWGR